MKFFNSGQKLATGLQQGDLAIISTRVFYLNRIFRKTHIQNNLN